LEELGFPREISVAPRAETTDRMVPVDAHAPHVVGDSASERFDASDVVTPLLERLPSHSPHLRRVLNSARVRNTVDASRPPGEPSHGPAPESAVTRVICAWAEGRHGSTAQLVLSMSVSSWA